MKIISCRTIDSSDVCLSIIKTINFSIEIKEKCAVGVVRQYEKYDINHLTLALVCNPTINSIEAGGRVLCVCVSAAAAACASKRTFAISFISFEQLLISTNRLIDWREQKSLLPCADYGQYASLCAARENGEKGQQSEKMRNRKQLISLSLLICLFDIRTDAYMWAFLLLLRHHHRLPLLSVHNNIT